METTSKCQGIRNSENPPLRSFSLELGAQQLEASLARKVPPAHRFSTESAITGHHLTPFDDEKAFHFLETALTLDAEARDHCTIPDQDVASGFTAQFLARILFVLWNVVASLPAGRQVDHWELQSGRSYASL
ncbi:uncharacterized protein [Physcomitrium patens]|uniref:uncharacterized protein n=1 Tax=Physcomitrium patens TaxID=3218 RepID=UPI003CCDE530